MLADVLRQVLPCVVFDEGERKLSASDGKALGDGRVCGALALTQAVWLSCLSVYVLCGV